MVNPSGVTLLVLVSLGLVVGSFLNVCVYRLPRGGSVVRPLSHCTRCGHTLRWFDNVPVVSYLILRGRCRTCLESISIMYPVVELVAPVLFLIQYWQVGWQPLLGIRLVFSCAMIVLFLIDLQHRILPNVVTIPGVVIGLVASFFVEPGWHSAALGVAVGWGLLRTISEVYFQIRGEEGLGMGDVKMLAMIGAFLGWQLMLFTLLFASLLGSLVGVVMIVLRRGDVKYALPFGSFLAISALVSTMVGKPFITWYTFFY